MKAGNGESVLRFGVTGPVEKPGPTEAGMEAVLRRNDGSAEGVWKVDWFIVNG